ncbi:MAG TPA: Lrp/AsnC family transcriptional regulator [Mycobacteriales bacterium]|jgi:DNA-binding Lrp family transcriptional regulator|nr:Lrp/AsnC family transcriptional regulator [Mycobacteriales bacterium]
MYSVDALDSRIVLLFASEPRIGVLEASRRIGVARGTVQARLDRLEAAGVITGWAPAVDPVALGFPVSAFATLEIAQSAAADDAAAYRGGHDPVASHLRTIPEVLEAHTITGGADMMVRLVARSNADLQRVIDLVVASPNVSRASTVIVLATEIAPRVLPLVAAAAPSG